MPILNLQRVLGAAERPSLIGGNCDVSTLFLMLSGLLQDSIQGSWFQVASVPLHVHISVTKGSGIY